MPAKSPTPERFFNTINAYQKTAALRAAIDLKFFTAIGQGAKTPAKLATRLKIAPRGARILGDYLAVQGFLTKSRGNYALAPDAALFLDKRSPAYLGNAVEFLCSPHLQTQFNVLADRVRSGGAPDADDNSLSPNHDIWVRFARGMAGLMSMPARLLAAQVLKTFGSAKSPRHMKILDIAAGHGMFGIAFLQQNPHAHVVGQDWPNVLTVALEHAAKFGVADRYITLPGSAFDVHFGEGYDVILIPNFLHHFDTKANIALLKKIHAALKPGGLAVTLEFAPDEDRLSPPTCGIFALTMLANTPGGDAYTVAEIAAMHKSAGFKKNHFAVHPIAMQRAFTAVKGK